MVCFAKKVCFCSRRAKLEGKAGERSGERFVNVPPWEIEVLLYAFSVSDEAPDAA